MNLKNAISDMTSYKYYGNEYYKVSDLIECLNNNEIDEIDDAIITPYYLTQTVTLEIYDYELNIRNTEVSNKEKYFINKTGKKGIGEIDSIIMEKLKLCYIEVQKGNEAESMILIKNYLQSLLDNKEIKQRVRKLLNDFNTSYLYLEIYF